MILAMAFFLKPKSPETPKRRDIPKDIWIKCPLSGEMIYFKELIGNWMVVPKSNYHFPLSAYERINLLADPGSFTEWDKHLTSTPFLGFNTPISYQEKLKNSKNKSGLNDAVVTGTLSIHGVKTGIAVMDFNFMGGSMGSVVGEKITRMIEGAIKKKLPVVIISTSGGARMFEGIISLMQMAKTSLALGKLSRAQLPFISVLTNPTMAGVMASFASLGDIIIAEPGALIGFAGPRVIEETTRQKLPKGFQTAEFLLEHGLIDQIVVRSEMKERLAFFLKSTLFCHK
ncbi:MAG: acetyl-CoA carboxylase, carboxyltransferase subunit beta [Puniceicoccales bacterium]|jgi:acetyl-CoA carboxylase carboxyl transferase subunit beta|nr:acetyl-CoA carboxylase, carboxyltransferase subunit beta [Puniceicoccales bacterium]